MIGMEENRNGIFSALVGAGCGFAMALCVLFAFIRTDYAAGPGGMAAMTVIAAVLPWLPDGLRTRGMRTGIAEGVMIVVSFIITALYCLQVTAGDGFDFYFQQMRVRLLVRCGFAHLVSLAFLLVRAWIRKRSGKQS